MAKKRKRERNVIASLPKFKTKRFYLRQADIPRLALSEALRLPQSLYDDFAGGSAAPHQLAISVNISPTSSNWRELCGASIAYGLTQGGYNAKAITLTDLGKRIVSPTEEGQDTIAKVEAALRPSILRQFYDRYNKAKFPQEKIAKNVLASMGVPQDELEKVLEIIKRNGEYVGIIHQTKTGSFVAIDTPVPPIETGESAVPKTDEIPGAVEIKEEITTREEKPGTKVEKTGRVFISHGKNKDVVNQLKDLLIFGKFTPVVAEEHETPSKPVPDKVLDDMRSCSAGIIHIEGEDVLLDSKGTQHHKINENVLIEIGAAMALYKHNFILLVQKGIHLPSNLQGLYQCFYDGEKLDGEATMKLLKAFNEFN